LLLDPRPRAVAPVEVRAGILVPAVACLAIAGLSLLLPSTPTYDPWAWILWGREIVQGELVTVDGPSWKPLPVLFTVPFALFGDAAPALWLVVARAGTIAGGLVALRLAMRLGGPLAGVIALVGLGSAAWIVRNGALGNSEGLLVLCVLGAVDRHLSGHRGQAFALGVAAGLLRPEAWPFLGLYALWLLWEDRGRLRWVAPGLLTLPLLWLAPERWGSGSFWRAAERAQEPLPGTPAFAERPALVILERFAELLPPALWVGIVAALALGLLGRAPVGRARQAVVLATVAVAWVVLVALMTEAGFSGNSRYLIAPAALAIVLAAAGLSWLAGEVAGRLGAGAQRAVVAVVLVAGLVGVVVHAARELPPAVADLRYQAALSADLDEAVALAGGREALLRCGDVFTNRFFVQLAAWELGLHGNEVDYWPDDAPAVLLRARSRRGGTYRPRTRVPGERPLARTSFWRVAGACA
jgi:hypothetical protein